MAETDDFAVDAAVSPSGVVGGHLDHKSAHRCGGGWPSWWSVRLGPVSCDSASVPTKEGVGCYQPANPSRSGQGLSDRAEQAPIVIGDQGPGVASSEHGKLVAQDDDFEILGATRTNSQTCHRREETIRDTEHGASLIGQRCA